MLMQKRPVRKMNIPGYMWRDEVKQKLDIDDGTLDAFIKNERIRRIHPPGMKQWVYSKEDVDTLYTEIRSHFVLSESVAPLFTRAQPEDMEEIMHLLLEIFPEDQPVTNFQARVERRRAWLEKNPETCFVLKVEQQIIGVIFILPLSPTKVEHILTSEPTPPIQAEEVSLFEPGVPLHVWVMSLGITPHSTLGQKRHWAKALIRNVKQGLITFGKRGIVIERIVARSDTKDGITLMRHFGFTEIPSVTHQRNFVVDVAASGIPEVMDYKDALLRYQGREPPPRPTRHARLSEERGKYEE